MTSSPPCPRLDKWIGGCRFEAVFEQGPASVKAHNSWGFDLPEIIEASKRRVYVHHYCTRCGKTIHREGQRDE